jgi:5'-3' exonuclease
MKLKLIAAILLIAATPSWAQAQSAVTNEDTQEVFGIISGDKDKMQAYCDSIKLGDQIEQDNQQGKSTDELNRKMDELTEKLGPEYAAFIAAAKDIDLSSREGQETSAIVGNMIDKLVALCGPLPGRSRRD